MINITLPRAFSNKWDRSEAGIYNADQKEAAVKKKAMEQCQKRYILSDASKFNVISTIKFADLKKAEVITHHLENKEFKRITNIEEVFS